jgi:signal transduction histidine kinase
MKLLNSKTLEQIRFWFRTEARDVEQQELRIRSMERNIALPIKAVVLGMLIYHLFYSRWFEDVDHPRRFAVELIERFFLFYVALNVAVGSLLLGMAQLPIKMIQVAVFIMAVIDGVFLATLLLVTGGIDSILFWFFPALIVRNAISVPIAPLQILLNCLVCFSYAFAGLIDISIGEVEMEWYDDWRIREEIRPPEWSTATEPLLLRVSLLLLVTTCGYGVQFLFDKQRRAAEEAREFVLRQEQLRVSGRLAGEIAHRLKNPLGIINNAAFNLQRNVKEGKATITQQIRIIREEVDRSDRIITDLMGYARLAEGKIERLDVNEELETAITQVFPPKQFDVVVERHYGHALPALLMQRTHLLEIFVNLLLNARQAVNGVGLINLRTYYENQAIIVTISDNGPGIAAELREKVFEPYFTTKEKGSGLGLAIVKHNIEIYDGMVEVKSELGRGATFTLMFPVRPLMKLR